MIKDLILVLTGIIVGGMNSVAGGGSLIGFPVLLALGTPAIVANATLSLVVLPGNIGATYGYRKYLKRVPKQYLLLLIPAVIGSGIGAYALRRTSFTDFEHYIPWLILFAAILFAFQPFFYKQLHHHIHNAKNNKELLKPILKFSFVVLVISIYAGYFGAGFGFVMLAFLGFTKLHNHVHRMNALKNVIVIFTSLTTILVLFSSHLIDWRQGLIMAFGNFIGGYYGAIWAQKVSSNVLRVIIIIIGFSTAIYLGLRSY